MASIEEKSASGAEFLGTVLEYLEAEIEISARDDDDRIIYELTGDTALFKGKPDLVSALTLLTAQAASRKVEERVNCLLDIDGQFEARRALLETAANDAAHAIQKNGRRAVFTGLNASERRVVHSTLKEREDIATRSEGDERNRLLLVETAASDD